MATRPTQAADPPPPGYEDATASDGSQEVKVAVAGQPTYIGHPSDCVNTLIKDFKVALPNQKFDLGPDTGTLVLSPVRIGDLTEPSAAGDLAEVPVVLVAFDLKDTTSKSWLDAVKALDALETFYPDTTVLVVGCNSGAPKDEKLTIVDGAVELREVVARYGIDNYMETPTTASAEDVFMAVARAAARAIAKAHADRPPRAPAGPDAPETQECSSIDEALAPMLPPSEYETSRMDDVSEALRQCTKDYLKEAGEKAFQPPKKAEAEANDGYAEKRAEFRAQMFPKQKYYGADPDNPAVTATPAALAAEVGTPHLCGKLSEHIEAVKQAVAEEVSFEKDEHAHAALGTISAGLDAAVAVLPEATALKFTDDERAELGNKVVVKAGTVFADTGSAPGHDEPAREGVYSITAGSKVELVEVDGDWCKIVSPEGPAGWVPASSCVLRKPNQLIARDTAKGLQEEVANYRKFDPEPATDKSEKLQRIREAAVEIAQIEGNTIKKMELLENKQKFLTSAIDCNEKEVMVVLANMNWDQEHRDGLKVRLGAAAGLPEVPGPTGVLGKYQQLQDELAAERERVLSDQKYVEDTKATLEAGHIAACSTLRLAETAFERADYEANLAMHHLIYGGGLPDCRGLRTRNQAAIKRMARQARHRREIQNRRAQHDGRSKAVGELRGEADKYSQLATKKLEQIANAEKLFEGLAKLWRDVADGLDAAYDRRLSDQLDRLQDLMNERYELVNQWAEYHVTYLQMPQIRAWCAAKIELRQAEFKRSETSRQMMPGFADTYTLHEQAEARVTTATAAVAKQDELKKKLEDDRTKYLKEKKYADLCDQYDKEDRTKEWNEQILLELEAYKRVIATQSQTAIGWTSGLVEEAAGGAAAPEHLAAAKAGAELADRQ